MRSWLAARRRRRILAKPLPPAWEEHIARNVAIDARLPAAERRRLRELVQVFVEEKHWEGCGGLELTEEMKVTIAAQACVLVLHRELDLYADVESILVYPSVVFAPARQPGFFEQPRAPIAERAALIGEAVHRGPLIFAWDAVLVGGREEAPGNVVFHELAHKLDMANGAVDGTPPLPSAAARREWASAWTAALEALRLRIALGVPSVLDPYGATNEAEMFAVATEAFFLHPRALAVEYPALYRTLVAFYGRDAAELDRAAGGSLEWS